MTSDVAKSVAVVMTCYNEGAYIGEAVRSVLGQTRADLIDRIVIADDGSGAETIGVLRDIEGWDRRIHVIYGSGGAGLPAQRNRALAETTSPLFAILDGDDVWTADKLEQQTAVILADPKVGLVYSDYYSFRNDDLAAARRAGVFDLSASEDLTRAYFLNDPPIIPSTTLIRRSAFDACGGFDPFIRVFEDTDFYLRLSRRCRFALVDKPLLYKRNRSASITGGRRDLMAHHALVALKAASEEPRLLPLVTRRLADRARKLGNQRFLLGESEEARRLLRFATQLDPFNWKAWGSRIIASRWAGPARRVMWSKLNARRVASVDSSS
jgi:glycosyltransferase involved in cell wall biosynthesis